MGVHVYIQLLCLRMFDQQRRFESSDCFLYRLCPSLVV
jgi:hypothetical protein